MTRDTFAPVALAGNAPNLPADTATRTLRVLLMPDVNGTVEESDWELIEPAAADLAERIVQWCEENRERIRDERPTMPQGVTGRFREKWQPLARVAAIGGGRWPQAVAAMALADVEQVALDRQDEIIKERPHVVLLRHLAELWPAGAEFVPTQVLVESLIASRPEDWSKESPYGRDLTWQRLGRMLAKEFKVRAGRASDKSARGYTRGSLLAPWRSLGITAPGEPARPAQPAQPAPEPATSASSTDLAGSQPIPAGDYLTSRPGRCTSCGHHLATQGHAAACQESAS